MARIEKIEPPKVRMYAIRKKPKNVPILSTLTYWREDLRVLEPDEEIVEVIIKVLKNILIIKVLKNIPATTRKVFF